MVLQEIDELFEEEEKTFGLYDSYASSISDVSVPSSRDSDSILIDSSSQTALVPAAVISNNYSEEPCEAEKRVEHPTPPQKSGGRAYRNLRWTWLTPYRRLLSFVFILNVVVIVTFTAIPTWRSRLNYSNATTATAINLTVAILMRQEYVVNLLFSSACAVPLGAPLWLRRGFAKIYTYGGVHSGCAVSATAWYAISTGFIFWHLQHGTHVEASVAGVAFTILVLLLAMVISSYPTLRARYHNSFEALHRFAGWTIIALFWAETMLSAVANSRVTGLSLGQTLVHNPPFWCIIIITCSIVLPWLRLRQLTVRPEPLSDHAVRLHIEGERATVGQGFRLSDQPLLENHAFAAIADPEQGDSFSVLVSNAGDWTKKIIQTPPDRLWTRGKLQYGAIRVATLFQPVLVVATGSGIAPCLSLFNGAPETRCRVLWSAPRPLATFGQGVIDTVRAKDAEAIIIDTKVSGRPDLVKEAYWTYKAVGAEAVVVISNAAVTRKVIYGLESRGVPAFAPIFDS
ncbi:MAG: hypothetical protein Q9159_007434 [Coniocarpon cinnabarinum]